MDWRKELSDVIDAGIKLDEPLSSHTYFRIGGPAEAFVEIGDSDRLRKLITFCKSHSVPLMFIGRGTNLLVNDRGRRGVVVKLSGDFARVKFGCHVQRGGEFQCLTAGAAVALPRLSRLTAQRGLTGLEFAFGIPGSVGGALVMNAGAESYSIGEIVDSVEVVGYDGNGVTLCGDELKFGYRWSNMGEYLCVTQAHLRMKSTSVEETARLMEQIITKKKASQPLSAASAGCVFKNPPNLSAGKLIDECGLKGIRIGGAQVSEKHANFIVNAGGATAKDVLNLIDRIKSSVRRLKGVELELELKMVEYDG